MIPGSPACPLGLGSEESCQRHMAEFLVDLLSVSFLFSTLLLANKQTKYVVDLKMGSKDYEHKKHPQWWRTIMITSDLMNLNLQKLDSVICIFNKL